MIRAPGTFFRKQKSPVMYEYTVSSIYFFSENLGAVSEKHGKRFHQGITVMENTYHGRWDVNFMADYCWTLNINELCPNYKRKRLNKSFGESRKIYHQSS